MIVKKGYCAMQIVSGKNKGLKLNTPKTNHTRPTLSRVKEAVFSSIADQISGCHFLDLFAGTGQMGLEAISRGASKVIFVDNDADAIALVKENLQKLKELTSTDHQLYHRSASEVIEMLSDPADVIYIDPPYTYGETYRLLEQIAKHKCLQDGGLLILEQSVSEPLTLPDTWEVVKTKKYGKSHIHYLKEAGARP